VIVLNRFGDRLPLFPPRNAFFHWFLSFIAPLEFALFRSRVRERTRDRYRLQGRYCICLI